MRPLFFDTPVIDDKGDIHTLEEYSSGGGGSTVTVDSVLSTTSKNPVQNKVITNKINELENSIPEVDDSLSETSTNPVQNKTIVAKIKEIIASIPASIQVDDNLSSSSENPVQNKVITNRIFEIEDNIAEHYYSGVTYNIGDLVSYDGHVWKSLVNNNTAVPEVGANWINTNLGDELINVYSNTEKIIGRWIDGRSIYAKCVTGTTSAETVVGSRRSSSATLDNSGNIDFVLNSAGFSQSLNKANQSVYKWSVNNTTMETNATIQTTVNVYALNGNIYLDSTTSNSNIQVGNQTYQIYLEYVKNN